jgi:hypothetical protein
MVNRLHLAVLLFVAIPAPIAPLLAAGGKGELEVRVIDKDTGKPIAARMHLKDAKGKPVKVPKVPYWNDHFVFEDKIRLELPLGMYTFEMERGPEYRTMSGYFTLEKGANDAKEVVLSRYIDMSKAGWWSGDMHIHRDPKEIELHMLAEDLHVAPVITWWNDRNVFKDKGPPKETQVTFGDNRMYNLLAGEDEREGGALLYFNLDKPLPVSGSKREYPSPMKFVEQAKMNPAVHIDIEKPFWWDMPTWVASGQVNSIGLAHNHMHRDGVYSGEAWGKARDTKLYPEPRGNGRWTMDIYFNLLNAGIRLPPSAGSASGVLPNPVGYNRVYVHCGDKLTWESWFENLRKGRVVVTNGPMMQPRVHCTPAKAAGQDVDPEGALPGHVFQVEEGESVELDVALNLSTRDKIQYLEVIKDGKVAHEVRLDEWAKKEGHLPPIKFEKSGWLAVRGVADAEKTYRFAMTGPYYVQVGYKPTVSKKSAQFFLDWVVERAKRIKLDDEAQKAEVLEYHRMARDFWKKKVDEANSE